MRSEFKGKKFALIFFITGIFFFLLENHPVYGQDKPRYVSNQIIVRYKKDTTPAKIEEQVSIRELRAKSLLGKVQNFVENRKLGISGQETPEKKLELLEGTKTDLGVAKAKNILGAQDIPESSEFVLYETDGRKSVEEMMQVFKSLPGVAHVEPNLISSATEIVPNDTYYQEMWNLKKIGMEKAWDLTKGSGAVKVAVIDSGVDYLHEDFAGRTFVDGYDFTTCNFIGFFGCIDGNEKERDSDPMDENGHGTHVAGTIGAVVNNSLGVSGINWNLTMIPIRVLNRDGEGFETDITDGIKYAADHGAAVINLSLAGSYKCDESGLYQAAVNYALSKGITIVVAAGNENSDVANSIPANCPGVIAVAATGPNDERASYSNYGDLVDIAAPGGNNCNSVSNCIKSTGFDKYDSSVLHKYYAFKQGTSMACPHVAGVVALMKALNLNLRPDEIETLLKNNTDPFPNPPDYPIGAGRLNAFKVLGAIGGAEATPTPTPARNCPAGDNGNLNCDIGGKINEADLCLFLRYWAPNGPVSQVPPEYHSPDLNNDVKVNSDDLVVLRNNWTP